jgi:hypothetical protein
MASKTSAGLIGMGQVLAIILSWTVNKSILWCILHFFCSWIYVLYWVFAYSKLIRYLETLLFVQ